ncbi:cupin domain-containing protein [Anaerobaca lacustris]|uniref:Cupin domain-containing protein n=1 Tax=Anaerobaca lacustris TaxID=3044600 RepID=A0AAW6TZ97_9BACT|nr:cupin domain-containing protein [Sedimentisphaerales bacterium M17dextr]
MFAHASEEGYATPLEGIRQKTLTYGAKTLMTEFRLQARRILPLHRHPYEQTGYLVCGRLRLTIGQQQHDTGPGDSWCIAPDVIHGAEVIEDSVAIEVFAPPREDYLPRPNR